MFMGLDLSLTATGMCVVNEEGALCAHALIQPGDLRGAERLAFIYHAVSDALDCRAIALAAVEGYSFGSRNRSRAYDAGELGGVVRMALFLAGVEFVIVAPTRLKSFLTGNGHAKKPAMQKALRRRFRMGFQDDNLVDAAALAMMAYFYHHRLHRGHARYTALPGSQRKQIEALIPSS